MKYIDAEKLKKAIEDKGLDCSFALKMERLDILALIDSLQQEQSKTDLDADIEMEWDSFNKHLAEYDKESEEVVWLNRHEFNDVAHYFYEQGQHTKYQQDREEFAKLKAREWINGYDEGYAKGLNAKKEENK